MVCFYLRYQTEKAVPCLRGSLSRSILQPGIRMPRQRRVRSASHAPLMVRWLLLFLRSSWLWLHCLSSMLVVQWFAIRTKSCKCTLHFFTIKCRCYYLYFVYTKSKNAYWISKLCMSSDNKYCSGMFITYWIVCINVNSLNIFKV